MTNSTTVSPFTRLLAAATRLGRADTYLGRRRWPRFLQGAALEVRVNGKYSLEARRGELQNISAGGIGVRIDEPVGSGEVLFIRIPAMEEWSKTEVVHCTPGLGRYLVGARCLDPTPWVEPEDQRE